MLVLFGFYLVILLYSVIIHEVAHGVAALWLGDRTAQLAGRLTLNPRTHIDPLGSVLVPAVMIAAFNFAFGWARPVPYNPNNLRGGTSGEVAVALAGPASNFVLAILAAIAGALLPLAATTKQMIIAGIMGREWEMLTQLIAGSGGNIAFMLLMIIIFWNVLLGVFNLLPIPPLDGSKLLFALVPMPDHVRGLLEQWGFFLVLGMIFLFPMPFYFFLQTMFGVFFNFAV